MLELAQPFEELHGVPFAGLRAGLRGRFAAPLDEAQGWQAVPPIRNILYGSRASEMNGADKDKIRGRRVLPRAGLD